MADRILSLRELNRATLARQLLLERTAIPVPTAIERLAGLQAQLASAPYVGVWTRLSDFQRADLASLIDNHRVVKATWIRGTLHLITAEDYLRFRATVQAALTHGAEAIAKQRGSPNLDVGKLLDTARAYIAETPRTFAEISEMLAAWQPDQDVGAMRYTVRMHLPMVQVPIPGGWSYPGTPQFTLAESWLGQPIPTEEDLRALILRYLAAFGPATVADMQTWSGLPRLKATIDQLRSELRVYRDENRRELFDLPDLPLPAADTPAPERFLPEFDNLLLSHSIRTRVVADEHRKKVYLPGLRVAATILIDGFVRGTWKIEKKKGTATLVIEPFDSLTAPNRAALTDDGERLLRFVEPDAKTFEVRFGEPP